MTPKEKAIELVEKFQELSIVTTYNGTDQLEVAKNCALIAVDEIIDSNNYIMNVTGDYIKERELFWEEVKQEIEKQ